MRRERGVALGRTAVVGVVVVVAVVLALVLRSLGFLLLAANVSRRQVRTHCTTFRTSNIFSATKLGYTFLFSVTRTPPPFFEKDTLRDLEARGATRECSSSHKCDNIRLSCLHLLAAACVPSNAN